MGKFLNRVSEGLNKSVATVSANSKAMVEKSKVNSIIKNLENEHAQLIELLGKKVYENYKSNGDFSDAGAINFVTEIDNRLELIEQQKEQLKRIDEEVTLVTKGTVAPPQGDAPCECGKVNAPEAKFCAGCGSQV